MRVLAFLLYNNCPNVLYAAFGVFCLTKKLAEFTSRAAVGARFLATNDLIQMKVDGGCAKVERDDRHPSRLNPLDLWWP